MSTLANLAASMAGTPREAAAADFDDAAFAEALASGEVVSFAPHGEAAPPVEFSLNACLDRLSKDSSVDDVRDVLREIRAGGDEGDLDRSARAIKDRTGYSIKLVRGMLEGIEAAAKGEAEAKRAANLDRTRKRRDALRDGSDIPMPPADFGEFVPTSALGRAFIARAETDPETGEDLPPRPMFSSAFVSGAGCYIDREEVWDKEITQIGVRMNRQTWRILAGTAASRDQLIALSTAKGMAFMPGGDTAWHTIVRATQPDGINFLDQMGLRRHGEEWLFALPSGALALGDPARYAVAPDVVAGLKPPTAGTLEGAIGGLGAICRAGSHSLEAIMMAGVVGPILSAVQAVSHVIVLTGLTSKGKSWRTEIAVSMSGPPEPGDGQMRSLNATANGLELPLARAGGGILGLDEMKNALAADVQDLIFKIIGGLGKSRMRRDLTEAKLSKWGGCVVIMSTEVSVFQRLVQERQIIAGGLRPRMTEIWIDGGERLSDDAFRTINACKENYGHVLPAVVRYMAERGYFDDPSLLVDRMWEIVETLPGTADDPAARRAAIPLGYIQVAGEMMCSAGLLPEEYDPHPAIRSIWDHFLSGAGAPEDQVAVGIANLCRRLAYGRGVDVVDAATNEGRLSREPIAWREDPTFYGKGNTDDPVFKALGGKAAYVVPLGAVGRLAGSGTNMTELREGLREGDYLMPEPRKDAVCWSWRKFPGRGQGPFLVLRADLVEEGVPDATPETPPEE